MTPVSPYEVAKLFFEWATLPTEVSYGVYDRDRAWTLYYRARDLLLPSQIPELIQLIKYRMFTVVK